MMDATPMSVKLEPSLDIKAAALLADEARQLLSAGGGLELDAEAVQRVGMASLQLLLSVRRTFAAQGLGFTLKSPSAAFVDACGLAGAGELLEGMEMQGSESC